MPAVFGIMQGRLSPPEGGRLQSFPRNSWRQEIIRAREAGVSYMEWIYDDYGASVNPIVTERGVAELNALKQENGIETPAICGDWFMDYPLVNCSEVQEARWGSITKMHLPGGGEVGLYQPRHPMAIAGPGA